MQSDTKKNEENPNLTGNAENEADDSSDHRRTIYTQLTKSSASIANKMKYDCIMSEFMDNSNYTDISLLNDFDHCIAKHCMDDREFEWIYRELTEENEIISSIDKSNNILHGDIE